MTDSKLIEPGFPFRPELEKNDREIHEQLLPTYFGISILAYFKPKKYTVKSRAIDQSTAVYYSIYNHFGGATNRDVHWVAKALGC